jgi:DNA-binding GntR family transcriptional regulator
LTAGVYCSYSKGIQASRREQVYVEIKHRIVHGVCAPGAPLCEAELARQLRTSRTPVREALSRLIEEGYVERVAGRGYLVTPITVTLIQNVFEVRRLLEGAAAARAAEFADAAAIARLRELATCEYASGDAAGFRMAAEANGAFHLALAQASRNAIIANLVRHCLDQVTRIIALGVDYAPLQRSASGEHDAVVDAIARRDPEGARAAVERHLDGSTRRMMDALMHGGTCAVTVSRAAAVGS